MNSKMIRVVLTAAACLGILAIPTTQSSTTSSADQEQGSSVLISNSGYMVAIG